MKLKNQLLMNEKFLNIVTRLTLNDKLPTLILYKLKSIVIPAIEQAKIIEWVRVDLVKKYWEEVGEEGNKNWQVKKENIDEFMKEISILVESETEIFGEPVTLKMKDDERIGFTIDDLEILKDFLIIEEKV